VDLSDNHQLYQEMWQCPFIFPGLFLPPSGAPVPLANSSRVTVPVHPYSIKPVEFAFPQDEPTTQALQ
jgi:hypothetical protein